MKLQRHKAEWCPYAEMAGKGSVFCQEGLCAGCQIWHDFSTIKGVSVSNCPLKLEVCYPSCYLWRDGNCTFEEAKAETTNKGL